MRGLTSLTGVNALMSLHLVSRYTRYGTLLTPFSRSQYPFHLQGRPHCDPVWYIHGVSPYGWPHGIPAIHISILYVLSQDFDDPRSTGAKHQVHYCSPLDLCLRICNTSPMDCRLSA